MVTISFEAAEYTITEGGGDSNGKVRIPITLSQSIQYALIPIIVTENGGATTRDYEVSHDSAYFWNKGNASVTVYAKDDSVVDGDGESITLSFGSLPSGIVAGADATTTITIVDND